MVNASLGRGSNSRRQRACSPNKRYVKTWDLDTMLWRPSDLALKPFADDYYPPVQTGIDRSSSRQARNMQGIPEQSGLRILVFQCGVLEHVASLPLEIQQTVFEDRRPWLTSKDLGINFK